MNARQRISIPDQLAMFYEDAIVQDPTARTEPMLVYQAYVFWAMDHRVKQYASRRRVYEGLVDKGWAVYQKGRHELHLLIGVRVKEDAK